MEDPKERLVTSVSYTELERRWKAAREVMRDRKIDFLVMRQDEEFYGGYVRWFSAVAPRHSYPFTVIFPIDDEMTTISSAPPGQGKPPEWAVYGVKERLGAPYYPSMHYTNTYDAELAVKVLSEKKGATIGWVGISSLHVNFHQYVTQHLPGATFVDMTDPIDYLKAIKSPEEIELIKGTAALQDTALDYVRQRIKPGLKDVDIHAEADYISTKLGCTRLQVLISSYQPGEQPMGFMGRHFMNRTLREGRSSDRSSRRKRTGRLLHGDRAGFLLGPRAYSGDKGYVCPCPRSPEIEPVPSEAGGKSERDLGCQQCVFGEKRVRPGREALRARRGLRAGGAARDSL